MRACGSEGEDLTRPELELAKEPTGLGKGARALMGSGLLMEPNCPLPKFGDKWLLQPPNKGFGTSAACGRVDAVSRLVPQLVARVAGLVAGCSPARRSGFSLSRAWPAFSPVSLLLTRGLAAALRNGTCALMILLAARPCPLCEQPTQRWAGCLCAC